MQPNIIKPEKSKFIRYFKSFFPFWKKKGIGLYGYIGHGDLGDDASFFVARKLLGNEVFPISKRCNAFNPYNLKALLIGGGAILKRDYPFIPRRILKKDTWKFPVILFSAGLGCDYNKEFTKEAKDKITKLCKICDYVTVRDRLSQKFLNDLGIDKVNILPHLELVLKEEPKELDFNKKRFTVGIVLTPHSEFSSRTFQEIIDNFVQFTNYLTDKKYDVVYLPFEKKISENLKENEVIQEIMKKVKNKDQVRILGEDVEPEEMLFIIKNYCDFMVCMRLHSAVLAVNAGKPFFCITYNLMHDGFFEMIELPNLGMSIFENFSFNALREKFEDTFENSNDIRLKLIEKRDFLRELIYQEIANIKRLLM